MFNQFALWLEQFPPATRILIVALVPAFLVFVLEEMTRPAHAPTPAAVQEVAVTHVFSQRDLDNISNLSSQSERLLQSLDQNMSQLHTNPNEPICLNGLRYGVYAYINNILLRMKQDLTTSLHMLKEEDEAYINDGIMDLVNSTITVLPAMDNTITVMTKGCLGDGNVNSWGYQIKSMLGQVSPALRTLQTHGRAKPAS